jgi:hypothetical protein
VELRRRRVCIKLLIFDCIEAHQHIVVALAFVSIGSKSTAPRETLRSAGSYTQKYLDILKFPHCAWRPAPHMDTHRQSFA